MSACGVLNCACPRPHSPTDLIYSPSGVNQTKREFQYPSATTMLPSSCTTTAVGPLKCEASHPHSPKVPRVSSNSPSGVYFFTVCPSRSVVQNMPSFSMYSVWPPSAKPRSPEGPHMPRYWPSRLNMDMLLFPILSAIARGWVAQCSISRVKA